MAKTDEIQIVFCTVPDLDTGRRIARDLVEYRFAACVNVVPGIESVYRWQGQVQCDAEALLVIKARAGDFAQLQAAILKQHPYELPEILAVPVTNALPEYLAWVQNHNEAK
ncbi:MAG: divalent-cation tolerance protein CutA [Thiogranum sp.]|nr:divalent-cation tolerance protein CutA [Thiogranum sp.]